MSGSWLPGFFIPGWGLVVQFSSCYRLKDMFVTNGKVFVHNESKWKDLPGSFTIPGVASAYQTYAATFQNISSDINLIPGLTYIVTFNITFKN